MCFTRIGYLCRHVFIVFAYNGINRIPDRYISRRWRRDALPKSVYSIENRYSVDNSEETKLRNDITEIIAQCMDRLRSHPDKLSSLRDELLAVKTRVFDEFPDEPACNRNSAIISNLYGSIRSGADDAVIDPPHFIRRKGRPSEKRMASGREKSVEQRKKSARLCTKCNKHVYDHNARTCDKVAAAKAAAIAASASGSVASGRTHP
jgi:hypothetical protein